MNRKIIALPLVGLLFLAGCTDPETSSISIPSSSSTSSSTTSSTTSSNPEGVTKLADVIALDNGAEFTSRGVYMGGSDKLNTEFNTYNSIYVADGETFYQLYRVDADLLPEGLEIGKTVLEFEGKVSNYFDEDTEITVYEASVSKVTAVEDSTVLPGVELTLDADHQVEVNQANINRKVSVKGGVVTNKTSDNYGNINIYFTVGDGSYEIKIDSRYGNVETDVLKDLASGDTFDTKTFVERGKFVYAEGLTITATGGGVTPPEPSEVIKLADVLALENGAKFTSRAVYMGGSDMVNEQFGTYNAIYVADGATPYLLYRMDADMLPADAVIGETVFEFEGTVANYTNDDGVTTHECSVQSLKVVEDDSVLPGVELVLDADHQVEITEENINKKVAVTGGVVTTKTSDNFGNININFTVGEGSYKIKIDSRYGRTDTDELTALKAGDTFNCKTFISANQFEYAEGLAIMN